MPGLGDQQPVERVTMQERQIGCSEDGRMLMGSSWKAASMHRPWQLVERKHQSADGDLDRDFPGRQLR